MPGLRDTTQQQQQQQQNKLTRTRQERTEPWPGQVRSGQVRSKMGTGWMVRALLPRATRSGLGGLKPSQLSRGLFSPGRWGKSKRLEGPGALMGAGLQSVGAPLGVQQRPLSRTQAQKRREEEEMRHTVDTVEAQRAVQRTDGARCQGTDDERGGFLQRMR